MKGKCGIVAIIGRPNVGKSTLMNHLLGYKVSITSRKPQTTRHRIHGILTRDDYQIIFADTPGIHRGQERALNRSMNQSAMSALHDVDVICFMVDADKWTAADAHVLSLIPTGVPVLLLVNKADTFEDKSALLPVLESLAEKGAFDEIIPVSALHSKNLDVLEQQIVARLPEGEFWFDENQITDRSLRFMVAEIVREKIIRQMGQELPHQVTVEVDFWQEHPNHTEISAVILVERKGQKRILIGSGGERIKKIGSQAREDIEQWVGRKVMLNLWVKVKGGWSDDERALRSLGYDDTRI